MTAAAPDRPPRGLGPAAVRNAMTVDVEDYFQVSAMDGVVDRADWDRMPRRVEANTERVLALFDRSGVKATFFTLGWVAQRHPGLIRRIVAEGHELASHGMAHHRVRSQAPHEFRADIAATKRLLEDIGGVAVTGYRAASFSVDATTPWAHQLLAEEGYRYSSSVYPVRHDHYGMPDAPRFAYRPAGANGVVEVPVSTVRLLRRNLPCGGGGYFRLLPYGAFRRAIARVNRADREACVFYFHPWEVDPDQPRPAGLSARTRFRHYVNLGRMERRLAALLGDFAWGRMDQVFLAPDDAATQADR